MVKEDQKGLHLTGLSLKSVFLISLYQLKTDFKSLSGDLQVVHLLTINYTRIKFNLQNQLHLMIALKLSL